MDDALVQGLAAHDSKSSTSGSARKRWGGSREASTGQPSSGTSRALREAKRDVEKLKGEVDRLRQCPVVLSAAENSAYERLFSEADRLEMSRPPWCACSCRRHHASAILVKIGLQVFKGKLKCEKTDEKDLFPGGGGDYIKALRAAAHEHAWGNFYHKNTDQRQQVRAVTRVG